MSNPADPRGSILTALARTAVAAALDIPFAAPDIHDEGWLKEPAATFVTLTIHGSLRGCIGSLEAHQPLIDDLRVNAVAAALADPRFAPLATDEFKAVRFEVSLLSPLESVPAADEEELVQQLRPEIDGVVLRYGVHRATFLPQVWEQLREPHQFLAQLKLKAGLPADFWHPDLKAFRYQVSKFCERTTE